MNYNLKFWTVWVGWQVIPFLSYLEQHIKKRGKNNVANAKQVVMFQKFQAFFKSKQFTTGLTNNDFAYKKIVLGGLKNLMDIISYAMRHQTGFQ